MFSQEQLTVGIKEIKGFSQSLKGSKGGKGGLNEKKTPYLRLLHVKKIIRAGKGR